MTNYQLRKDEIRIAAKFLGADTRLPGKYVRNTHHVEDLIGAGTPLQTNAPTVQSAVSNEDSETASADLSGKERAGINGIAAAAHRFWIYSRLNIAEWRRRACSRRELLTFDDRQLLDVGLTRVDVVREVNKQFWQ
jgi:uncharacterized protein YjiS (DUF1127 family)